MLELKLKKKTGVKVDGYGNIIKDDEKEENLLTNNLVSNKSKNTPQSILKNKDTKPITSYKPTGKLIYNNDILDSLRKA